jgi:predicted lysophospholipase L1 biosynthesis ABC-type transport system permease subunit
MRAVADRRLGNTPLADPLLLIGPSLLLIAAVMVFLRFVPFLLRLVARLSRRLRGLVLPLGLSHLAREPLQSSRLVLLVSLTAGLLLFTRTFGASLARGQDPRQPDALALGINATLQLNALTMVLFSVTTFFLVHLFAAQSRRRSSQRASDFAILRALGLSDRQWLALLVTEGLLVLTVGLLAGSVVGLGLSRLMIPYLGVALADPLVGVSLARIRLDWPAVTRAYALLVGVYGSALVLLTAILRRPRARLAPRLGDE